MPSALALDQERRDLDRQAVESRAVFLVQQKQLASGAGVGDPVSRGSSGLATGSFRSGARTREAYGFFKHWVYVATNAIAKRLGGQPVLAGEMVDATPNPDRRAPADRKRFVGDNLHPRLKAAANQQSLEVLDTHPALDVFRQPNPVQRKFEFLYSSAINLLITGESYWVGGVVDKGKDTERLEVWSIPTSMIEPDHSKGLFGGYKLKLGMGRDEPLDPANVARTYFPHPSDLRMAWSPLFSIHEEARTDEHIIGSQLDAFEQGIFPNVVVTIGRNRGPDGKLTDTRPVLTGSQRTQIVNAISELWAGTTLGGDPAIIDGLIESIHKLQNTPQEMDWLNSGDAVKRRIMQAYGVNPISVGETVGANRAQATEADNQMCENAVNPIGSALSETATAFIGPMYEEPDRLELWVEPCVAKDAELELRRWVEARKQNDVTPDEFRANQLGLGPDERPPRGKLLNLVGGVTGAVNLMTAVGNGIMSRTIAARMFEVFYEVDQETAEKLAGLDLPEEDDDEGAGEPITRPPNNDGGDEAEEELDEDADEVPDVEDDGKAAALKLATVTDVHRLQHKRVTSAEREVGHSLAQHFQGCVREVWQSVRRKRGFSGLELDAGRAEEQSRLIMEAVFDSEKWLDDLISRASQSLGQVFVSGALSEISLFRGLRSGKQTTAEEIAARLNIDVPPEFSIGSLPDWLLEAAREELTETFSEDYWTEVVETTREDVRKTLEDGISQGWSIRRVASSLMEVHGAKYNRMRATRVARTESANVLNAGHSAGIQNLEDELEIPIGKEWVSVLGSTTRATHAALDGTQTRSGGGTFSLGGVNIPWPGHHSLPASERVHCQCSLLSAPVMDSLVDDRIGATATTESDAETKPFATFDKQYPPVNPEARETFERFMQEDGNFSPARAALHEKIIDAIVGEGEAAEKPILTMLGGGPAAGKGSLFRQGLVSLPEGTIPVDSDEIKKQLPEFAAMSKSGDMRAAAYTHKESSNLSMRAIDRVVTRSQNVMLDGTGNGALSKLRRRVERFRKNGHRIHAHYVSLSNHEEAVRRSELRAQQTGRRVPPTYIRETHKQVSRLLPEAIDEGLFDELDLWDNTEAEPIRIASVRQGQLTIHEPDLWETFLANGR